ncbi:CPBP family intramembrane metalloprotease [Chryseobacterium indologenes]|uniref:CPBP family intramembrane glutamic endopeptidase n=1 Tax=Chryseobacterium indologenes TaxID=253 RepID=UPI0004B380B9|nr:CPBP family intramembrane glutamic endopeptidase [Chryseobacterium indologenes]ATN07658.1 CPBP family intramembrane metalloprotease [Chryseobacterium indologenes]AYY83603.1 CPBP family intramembrane metalloprotease [Chryseobacterium indologenes]QIX80525.1 CPBP family intramembrane metalloprotease [Chryseobacterium indologenes]QPQ53553.1 CPBP family intramembrane metalloprotease [Chryseobacterium indologenes]UDQ54181.1 CPBP family intramembrane metalloprotease [Chryseobacterium indologenes]
MSKNIRFYLSFIIGFSVYYFFDAFCFKSIQTVSKNFFHSKALAHIIAYSITLLPLLITGKILLPGKSIFDLFSLNTSIKKGFTLAFTGTLPMLTGYFVHFGLSSSIHFESLFINTVSSAFFEEIIFRAFLIGISYRFTALGFLSSVLLGSLLFAQVHLYQSQDPVELLEIFSITFLGSIFFAWIYFETDFNLWTAIFAHFFMNLYWEIYNVSENVSGNLYGNIYKILSLLVIILLIIYDKKRHNTAFRVTLKSLFIKSREAQS